MPTSTEVPTVTSEIWKKWFLYVQLMDKNMENSTIPERLATLIAFGLSGACPGTVGYFSKQINGHLISQSPLVTFGIK